MPFVQFLVLCGVMIAFAAISFGPLHTDQETRRLQFYMILLGILIFCSAVAYNHLPLH